MSRPRHRSKPGATYFVTTNTWERREMFRKAPIAEIVERKLFEHRDKGEYFVHAYVVMPDHLHVIVTPGRRTTLERALQLIKGGSSHDMGKVLGGRLPVWLPGFTEHEIRDQTDYATHVQYIELNPVKAGLASRPGDYPFSSACSRYRLDPWPVASGAKALA